MTKIRMWLPPTAGVVLALASAPAVAAPPSSTEAEASDPPPSGRRYSKRSTPKDRDKWIYRWAPTNNMGEIGVYGGVWFPNRRLELFEPNDSAPNNGHQRLRRVAPDVGIRGGYYPLRFVGVEAEAGVMPTSTEASGGRATVWTVRGHVIGQLGLWSVTPFLLAGVGILGVSSPDAPEGIGSEQDVTIHVGGGVKFYINKWIQLRLDVRDVISNRQGVGEGLASSPEVLLGLTVTLGRKKKRKPKPGLGDKDGDGVLDAEDFCPDVFGEPPRGCPTVCIDDNDADGLTNPEDQCPNDPETRNGFEDKDGCPDEVPPELEDLAGVMEGIHFDTDRDTIKPDSKPSLDKAVDVLTKYKDIRILVVGHTDSRGGYRHNIDLSQRRAKAVKQYLVDAGVDASRIDTDGVGPDQPIDTNDTAAGRARNRRIEFTIMDEAGGAVKARVGMPKPDEASTP